MCYYYELIDSYYTMILEEVFHNNFKQNLFHKDLIFILFDYFSTINLEKIS